MADEPEEDWSAPKPDEAKLRPKRPRGRPRKKPMEPVVEVVGHPEIDPATGTEKPRGRDDETEAERRRGLSDFYHFATEHMGMDLLVEAEHRPICDFFQRGALDYKRPVLADDVRFHHVQTPRDTLKSSIFSVSGTSWLIVVDPDVAIMLAGEEQKKAAAWWGESKQRMGTEKFKRIHGDPCDPDKRGEWTKYTAYVATRRNPRKDPTIACVGTNMSAVGGHYDVLIYDDIVSIKNAQTDDGREKMYRWFAMTMPLGQGRGGMNSVRYVVGTPYDEEDLYTKHINGTTKLAQYFDRLIIPAYDDDRNLNFPVTLPEAALERVRGMMPPELYMAQYELNPLPGRHGRFRRDMFKIVPPHRIPVHCYTYLLSDFATSLEKHADLSCHMVVAIDSNRRKYVLDAAMGKWEPMDSIRRAVTMARRHRAWNGWGMEEGPIYNVLLPMIRTAMAEAGVSLRIVTLPRSGSRNAEGGGTERGARKIFAIQRLAFEMERNDLGGVVWANDCWGVREREHWNPSENRYEADGEIVKQFVHWQPGRGRDDAMDCLSMADELVRIGERETYAFVAPPPPRSHEIQEPPAPRGDFFKSAYARQSGRAWSGGRNGRS